MTMVPSDMRTYHRGMVLRLLRDSGPMSRAEAARRCRLSPPTVGDIIAGLLEEGVVTELQPALGRTRRRSVEIALAAEACHVVGVHIGEGMLRVGTMDLFGRLVLDLETRLETRAPVDEVARTIAESVARLRADPGDVRGRLLGLGATMPGIVDQMGRRLEIARVLGWRDVALGDLLEGLVGLRTVLDHNVRAMALAEARYGCARDAGDLLYVCVGSGVGIGMVVGGEAFHARLHGAPEFGHQQVVRDGEPCSCGAAGCLETVVSEPALLRRARAVAVPGSVLSDLLGAETPALDALQRAAAAGDAGAGAILGEFCETLATALASAVNLLTPEVVVFGGILAHAAKETVDGLRQQLHARVSPAVRDAVRIERSGLGGDAGVLGAGTIALDRFFYRAGEPQPG